MGLSNETCLLLFLTPIFSFSLKVGPEWYIFICRVWHHLPKSCRLSARWSKISSVLAILAAANFWDIFVFALTLWLSISLQWLILGAIALLLCRVVSFGCTGYSLGRTFTLSTLELTDPSNLTLYKKSNQSYWEQRIEIHLKNPEICFDIRAPPMWYKHIPSSCLAWTMDGSEGQRLGAQDLCSLEGGDRYSDTYQPDMELHLTLTIYFVMWIFFFLVKPWVKSLMRVRGE